MTITVGTKIKVTNTAYNSVPNGSIMTVTNHIFSGAVDATVDGGSDGFEWYMEAGTYEVLEDDTQDTPTPWKDMTPEQKGSLLLAYHERKTIEVYCTLRLSWVEEPPMFLHGLAYRIAPEPPKPVVETVDVYLKANKHGKWIGSESLYTMTHSITFDTIDGVPDTGSIKMAEV